MKNEDRGAKKFKQVVSERKEEREISWHLIVWPVYYDRGR